MTYSLGMFAVSNNPLHSDLIAPVLAMLMVAVLCYIGGRVHQFYRQGVMRDAAFRQGYNLATTSLFSLAARSSKGVTEAPPLLEQRRPRPAPVPMRGTAAVKEPKHQAKGKSTRQESKSQTAWDLYKSA